MMTSPPLPPSPPEGPPRGTNFSRRNAMHPLPPSPAFNLIFASSINMRKNKSLDPKVRPYGGRPGPRSLSSLLCFQRFNHHELAHRALIHELDAARNFGEERVVFASTDVQPRFHAGAALSHDDGPAGHNLPAKCLEPQPLRVGIAPVS